MAEVPIKYSAGLLAAYSSAALQNARELLAEATLLYEHGHYARAYFLAVASMEETGKAFLAFDSQRRNFEDPAVCSKLTLSFLDHKGKINGAFYAWLNASGDPSEALMPMVNLMVELARGREPSMYTDVRSDTLELKVPSALTRDVAAHDCIRLATACIEHTMKHVAEKEPQSPTRAHDQLFALGTHHLTKLMNTEDWWWFYISEAEAGRRDFAEAVRRYRSEYVAKGRLFKTG
jgi:AbiV family abortive infection protein